MDTVRAVTYGRQSHKNETDSQTSPLAQRQAGEAYISSQRWEHTEHYQDVGLSGYDPNVYRPDFERLMADARARKFDVVVVYMLSRLTRQGAAEAFRIQEELRRHGVALVSVTEPFISTFEDNPFGPAFFALIAGLAHQESKNKSRFIRDAFAELKARGSHSSGPVPFGFRAEPVQVDGLTIRRLIPLPPGNPAADTVRRIIDLATEGHGENRIATTLTADGIPTPLAARGEGATKTLEAARQRRKSGPTDDAPAEWSATVVRRILRDPRLAGYATAPTDGKSKDRRILRDDDGQPVRPHEGFMSVPDWHALQEVLRGRKRTVRRDRGGELTLLGSWGLLRCGRCGSGMTVARPDGTYVCNLRRTVGDVPRHTLRIRMRSVDAMVAESVWARVGGMDPGADEEDAALLLAASRKFAARNVEPGAAEELAEQTAQLDYVRQSVEELYQDRRDGLYAGEVGRREFAATIRKYQDHETACEEQITRLQEAAQGRSEIPLAAWQDGNPFAPGGLWHGWDVRERREFLALWVDAVTILPMARRTDTPADRVRITWAQAPELIA